MFAGAGAAQAQTPELRNLNSQFKGEAGCPVQVVSSKTVLEIDPIGTPMACRIYLDYKNSSAKTISGVKFRIGYIDGDEKIRGTFHAPDGHVLEPGGTASAKWRGDKVDPRVASTMIRVLVVRYSDGSTWESEKMKDLAPGTGGPGSPSSDAGAASSAGASDSGSSSSPAGLSGGSPSDPAGQAGMPAQEASPAAGSPGSDKSTDGY